jgi:hypothetical protein
MSALRGKAHRATLTFLNLPVNEVQETSDWRTHDWNVMSEQCKSNWQHPNTYYREREETPGNDECDTSQHPHPYRSLPTKAVQIMANPSRDVILEAVHFLVEIGNPRHARLSGMLSIRSYSVMRQRPSRRNLPARSPRRLCIRIDGKYLAAGGHPKALRRCLL